MTPTSQALRNRTAPVHCHYIVITHIFFFFSMTVSPFRVITRLAVGSLTISPSDNQGHSTLCLITPYASHGSVSVKGCLDYLVSFALRQCNTLSLSLSPKRDMRQLLGRKGKHQKVKLSSSQNLIALSQGRARGAIFSLMVLPFILDPPW